MDLVQHSPQLHLGAGRRRVKTRERGGSQPRMEHLPNDRCRLRLGAESVGWDRKGAVSIVSMEGWAVLGYGVWGGMIRG